MHFERQLGVGPKRLQDRGAHAEVRHEMAVHHIDVNAIRPRCLHLAYLLAKSGEVGGQDRGGDTDHVRSPRCCPCGTTPSLANSLVVGTCIVDANGGISSPTRSATL